ncbi:hypothetical protein LINPERPRIM_LOCUS1994 [Linum perenne]
MEISLTSIDRIQYLCLSSSIGSINYGRDESFNVKKLEEL